MDVAAICVLKHQGSSGLSTLVRYCYVALSLARSWPTACAQSVFGSIGWNSSSRKRSIKVGPGDRLLELAEEWPSAFPVVTLHDPIVVYADRMVKAFCYRLYPTRQQERAMTQMLDTHRHLYNRALAERRDAWEQERRSVHYSDQSAQLKVERLSNPYLAPPGQGVSSLPSAPAAGRRAGLSTLQGTRSFCYGGVSRLRGWLQD